MNKYAGWLLQESHITKTSWLHPLNEFDFIYLSKQLAGLKINLLYEGKFSQKQSCDLEHSAIRFWWKKNPKLEAHTGFNFAMQVLHQVFALILSPELLSSDDFVRGSV